GGGVAEPGRGEGGAAGVWAEGGPGDPAPAGHDGGGHRRDATPRLSTAVAILTRPLHRHPRPRSDSNRSWASASDERYNLLASGAAPAEDESLHGLRRAAGGLPRGRGAARQLESAAAELLATGSSATT